MRLILFDIDGTLLWPKGVGRVASKLATEEVFGTTPDLDNHYFGGKTDWRTLNELLPRAGFSEAEIERRLPAYNEAMGRHLARIIGDFPVQAIPHAHEMVAETLRREHLIPGLVTGNVESAAPIKLRAAGFDPDWFRIGAYGSEAADRNDLPFIALERAQQLTGTTIRPDEVVIIGDTRADIECARALGAVAVAVRTGYAVQPEELIASQPDYLLDDLSQFYGQVIP